MKELRAQRDWTQNEVANRAGIGRGYYAQLETDVVAKPSADTFLKLARTFNIHPDELYLAAGYIKEARASYLHQETSEEILERLLLTQPVSIPVYSEFPFHNDGFTEPVEYVYRKRTKRGVDTSIVAYVAHGDYFGGMVHDGDILIIDTQGEIDIGDILVCMIDEKMCLARQKKIADDLILETKKGMLRVEEAQLISPVIEVIRRLK